MHELASEEYMYMSTDYTYILIPTLGRGVVHCNSDSQILDI